jgi:hypothetical protein
MEIDDPLAAEKAIAASEQRSELIPFKGETITALIALSTVACVSAAPPVATAVAIGGSALGMFQSVAAKLGMKRQQQFIDDLRQEFQDRG